jgi:hypothetical protein
MKLISMTDFVLEQSKKSIKTFRFCNCEKYANFLKQTLELWMFVPCDEDGNVLDEQMIFASDDKDYIFESKQFDKYQQAKERCLFDVECIDISNGSFKGLKFGIIEYNITTKRFFYGCKIVEDIIDFDFELTKKAEKLIGL